MIDALFCWWIGLTQRAAARGVLLVSAGGFGDTVLFAAVLPRFLRLATKGEPVTVLLRHDGAKTAFLFPPHVRVRTVDFKRLKADRRYRFRVFKDLYHDHFRLVVSTDFKRHPHLDEALIRAAAAKRAVAMIARPWKKYDRALENNRRLFSRLFDSGGDHVDKVVRWSRFADWLTGVTVAPPTVAVDPDLLPPPADVARPTVVIQPFSAVSAKQPQVSLFAAIIDTLGEGTDVVLTGAPGDLEGNPDFAVLLDRPNVRFDSATFADIVALLRAARLVISVDTALMHLSVAVGATTLCLASAAYVGEIVPYAEAVTPPNAHFLFQNMDCAGCLGDCSKPFVDDMYPCVAALSADRVTTSVADLMRT